MITLVIGTQWGDEGKGKFIDIFAEKSDIVARYNGSGGAAHTVVNKYGKFWLHLLPCGVFYPNTKILITNGVMIEPELLLKEINDVEKAGISLKNRLFISPRCHLVFPYHKMLDRATNALFAKDAKTSPTTGRGNGPVHADKISYQGIRIYDLLDKKRFVERLKIAVVLKNKFIQALGGESINYKEVLAQYNEYAKKLKPYIRETLFILEDAVKKNKNILFEGVNGLFLDNDWGAYPHVTAVSILPSDVLRGSGINPYLSKHKIVGVAKAYMTRVDNGECPLPTEWTDLKEAKEFRDKAHEYAASGRPRRLAWFDAEVVKASHKLCNFDFLCLTRLDTLTGLKRVKICKGYKYKNKKISYFDGDAELYRKVKPLYEELDGWTGNLNACKLYDDLPGNTKKFIERIEQLTKIPVKYISVGAEREAVIKKC